MATEAFALAALRHAGVRTVHAEPATFGARPALVVERFDRRLRPDGTVERVHQEDCCQALGAARAERTERKGGPTLAEIADLVADMASDPETELTHLLQWVVAGLVFGKVDGTARDLALIYHDDECRLAPVASMAGTADYPERPRQLGLSIGGVDDLDGVERTHLLGEAAGWGMPPAVASASVDGFLESLDAAWEPARSAVDPGAEVVGACRRRLRGLVDS